MVLQLRIGGSNQERALVRLDRGELIEAPREILGSHGMIGCPTRNPTGVAWIVSFSVATDTVVHNSDERKMVRTKCGPVQIGLLGLELIAMQ